MARKPWRLAILNLRYKMTSARLRSPLSPSRLEPFTSPPPAPARSQGRSRTPGSRWNRSPGSSPGAVPGDNPVTVNSAVSSGPSQMLSEGRIACQSLLESTLYSPADTTPVWSTTRKLTFTSAPCCSVLRSPIDRRRVVHQDRVADPAGRQPLARHVGGGVGGDDLHLVPPVGHGPRVPLVTSDRSACPSAGSTATRPLAALAEVERDTAAGRCSGPTPPR